jgi:hypothetical protein
MNNAIDTIPMSNHIDPRMMLIGVVCGPNGSNRRRTASMSRAITQLVKIIP